MRIGPERNPRLPRTLRWASWQRFTARGAGGRQQSCYAGLFGRGSAAHSGLGRVVEASGFHPEHGGFDSPRPLQIRPQGHTGQRLVRAPPDVSREPRAGETVPPGRLRCRWNGPIGRRKLGRSGAASRETPPRPNRPARGGAASSAPSRPCPIRRRRRSTHRISQASPGPLPQRPSPPRACCLRCPRQR